MDWISAKLCWKKIAFVNFLDQRQIIGESNEKKMHNQLNYDLHFLKKKEGFVGFVCRLFGFENKKCVVLLYHLKHIFTFLS